MYLTRAALLKQPAYDRHRDGPDALQQGTPHTPLPQSKIAISLAPPELAYVDFELFLMRTRPELFEPWMSEPVEDARAALATEVDMFDWDCRHCRSAVMTREITDPCPNCRWS